MKKSAHGNRELFLDDVFLAYLLAFFNPTLRSLRTIEDFSQTAPGGASSLDPPDLQEHAIGLQQAGGPDAAGADPSGPAWCAEPQAGGPEAAGPAGSGEAGAGGGRHVLRRGGRRGLGDRASQSNRYQPLPSGLDVQIDIATWLPEVISVPEPGEGEACSAAQFIRPGAIHIYDRGYGSFELLAAHYELQEGAWQPRAEFVLRAKSHQLNFIATEERPLRQEELPPGIVSDRVGRLAGSQGHRAPQFTVREIVFVKEDGEAVRLLTNLWDVPAEAVAQVYRHRWQIQLFFRWLKCYARDANAGPARSRTTIGRWRFIRWRCCTRQSSGGLP